MSIALSRFVIPAALSLSLTAVLFAQVQPQDALWDALTPKAKLAGKGTSIETDWTTIAQKAEEFVAKYPADSRAPSARRIALSARLRIDEQQPVIPPEVLDSANAFIRDTANPVRERVRLTIDVSDAKTRRKAGMTYQQSRVETAELGRTLIKEFPAEADGYAILLVAAKTEVPDRARTLARELLKSGAPAKQKAGAQRVLDRLNLQNKKLTLKGADGFSTLGSGRPIVVYSWTMADEGFLEILRRNAKYANVVFVGVNLDKDVASAKKVGATLQGTQYYDQNGLAGPLADQLQLLFYTSLYTTDKQGNIVELDGHLNPERAILRAAAQDGGSS